MVTIFVIVALTTTAVVGDNITVVFKNMASFNFSIAGHGITIKKASEGFLYQDNTTDHSDDLINPSATFTYNWTVSENGITLRHPKLIPVQMPQDLMTLLLF
jgi:hypothetical protein